MCLGQLKSCEICLSLITVWRASSNSRWIRPTRDTIWKWREKISSTTWWIKYNLHIHSPLILIFSLFRQKHRETQSLNFLPSFLMHYLQLWPALTLPHSIYLACSTPYSRTRPRIIACNVKWTKLLRSTRYRQWMLQQAGIVIPRRRGTVRYLILCHS